MLQAAKELQITAVDQLVKAAVDKEDITFKAPTGTGKTYMMAELMDRLLSQNTNLVFLVSSLSKGNLAEQNYEAFLGYKESGKFSALNPYLINTDSAYEERISIPLEYNVYILPRDLYKEKGRLKQGPMDNFLRTIIKEPIFGGMGKSIYLIKDECHQATRNLDYISSMYFSKTFNFSATPKLSTGQHPDVQITDEDAINAGLIKHIEWGQEEESLDEALRKYNEEIKPAYLEKLGRVPCMIIQISNKELADEEWARIIEPALVRHGIQWMYIVDKDKECKTNHRDFIDKPVSFWKKYARKDSSTVEVIVFKLAISEGWDIRRACMLYQIRSTKSKQLDEQVLGRIRRNPILLDYENYDEESQKLATTAWAWGMLPKTESVVVPVKAASPRIQEELKIKTTVLSELAKKDFDVDQIINNRSQTTNKSIFKLYSDYDSLSDDVKSIGRTYVQTYADWIAFASCAKEIESAYKEMICDYEKSMQLSQTEEGKHLFFSVPVNSYYNDTDCYINISNHLWVRTDGADDFAFDSEAERDFANILLLAASEVVQKTPLDNIFLWGKNYLAGSEIKYEYYLKGTHYSFPDFILKDKYNRIHLFEVKSINGSNAKFDSEQYKEKIKELKKCYKQASALTGHIFYLPIKDGRSWKILRYKNGEENNLTKDQLIEELGKGDD